MLILQDEVFREELFVTPFAQEQTGCWASKFGSSGCVKQPSADSNLTAEALKPVPRAHTVCLSLTPPDTSVQLNRNTACLSTNHRIMTAAVKQGDVPMALQRLTQ